MAKPKHVVPAPPPADTPRPALLPPPPEAASSADTAGRDSFLLRGGLCDAWFLRRSDVLLVTFDNLASVGEYDPPQPWLQARAALAGLSILGLLAHRKDWYRNPDTPALIIALRAAGLFDGFRRIVFTGASMGGYAALAYSALVPGSVVLAFSPQTSLAPAVTPFEQRYRYAARKWDWASPTFLDAAASAPHAAEVHLVYDPFVPEDHAHAARVTGQHVNHIRVGHFGHRAIRNLKTAGLLQALVEDVAQGRFDPAAFANAFRIRRTMVPWQRALLGEAVRRRHQSLGQRAALAMAASHPGARFARRAAEAMAAPAPPQPPAAERAARPKRLKASGPLHDVATYLPGSATTGPFRGAILHLHQALVVPEREHDVKLASGVLRSDGEYEDLSRAWIRAGKSTPIPTLSADEPVTNLPGAHLFAGHFRGHFGHFLVESTARLWALDHLKGKIDSILYLPYRGTLGPVERAIESHDSFFRLLGIDTPIRTYATALRVEQLHLPELGFGWSDRYAGSPAYRAFMQGRLGGAVTADGGAHLYISRAQLNAQRGGILGETVIEENLARAGYDIFHPERHPLEVQIARYKAARSIVALDGSALHLAAYVVRPATRVAIILRRSKANVADYALQYRSFCGIDPDVVDVIRRDWVAGAADRIDFRSVGELDFTALFNRLKSLGVLAKSFRPDVPDDTEIRAMLDRFGERRGEPFRTLTPGERLPDEAAE